MDIQEFLPKACLPAAVDQLLRSAPSVRVAHSIDDLEALACGGPDAMGTTVSYELPDRRRIDEVDVVRVRNGISANYREAYMRRRDPECMVVADHNPSDKPHFSDRYDFDFTVLKRETFAWLGGQELAVFGFAMGQPDLGADALALCPVNAGFFAFGLGLLQGVVDLSCTEREFHPKTIISFGVRTPPCTREHPSYGIIGLLHVLPPALAWLWRLVAPRGHANPSIVDTAGMRSEGVGSYWPFTPGKKVAQANLLLQQFCNAPSTRYVLIPNQHVGAWATGFMPQWLVRDYLARRGHARFTSDQIVPSNCPLLGYTLQSMRIEGSMVPRWFLQVDTQPEVGPEAYATGAQVLTRFFHEQLELYLQPDLDALGRRIIDCCLSGGEVGDFAALLEGED